MGSHVLVVAMLASLVGLAATSSSLLGAAIGLYFPVGKRLLACVLAFAAGSLISALAIDLAYSGAVQLHSAGLSGGRAWSCVGGGFTIGALIYYASSLALDNSGAVLRSPRLFRDYALEQKRQASKVRVDLLAKCDLLRHLPAEAIEQLLPTIRDRSFKAGEAVFKAGDEGNALYIIERGSADVLMSGEGGDAPQSIASLGPGDVFGEMALLSGKPRTATICALTDLALLEIERKDFERLLSGDSQMAKAMERLSHGRALSNLSEHAPDPSQWAAIATSSVHHLTRDETSKFLTQAASGAGLAIVFGNVLDTIPGCLVIGAKFTDFASMSLTLTVGMFLSGIPEAAASGVMLTRAGFSKAAIFGLWSIVLVVGFFAAGAGKLLLSDPNSLMAVFAQGVAGGAVLALIAHTMIPEAIHDGKTLIVLPTVGGFLFSLYLSVTGSFG
jgi:CRP-like cAMP-binding protein